MKVFFMVVAALYILYLLFLVVRACSELRHMPYVGECHSGTHGQQGPQPCKALALESHEMPQERLAIWKEAFKVVASGPW